MDKTNAKLPGNDRVSGFLIAPSVNRLLIHLLLSTFSNIIFYYHRDGVRNEIMLLLASNRKYLIYLT